ncbi:MAG: hypothetical protein MUO53_16340, partial [Maribacter sp.]|nr:hypothetical protein [Maribacter sp.]
KGPDPFKNTRNSLKGNPSDEVQKSIDERRAPQKHLTEKRGISAMVLDGIFLTPGRIPHF